MQPNIRAYKNRHIPDDKCIRKNKKIEADAKLHLHNIGFYIIMATQ